MNDQKDQTPVTAHSLYDVIMNTEDRILAANIISNLTPPVVADGIVRAFNHQMMEMWRKRVSEPDLHSGGNLDYPQDEQV